MNNRFRVWQGPARFLAAAVAAVLFVTISPSVWAASLTPLTSFGGGDGWLAPGDRSYLTTDNTQRGLAYNPATGHILVVNRSGGLSINVLDGTTGDDLGTLGGAASLTGGTFAGSMVGVANDGAIYVANLTTEATGTPFKIYRWASETAAAPTVAYSGTPLAGARIGDSFDVIGSGLSTQFVAGYAENPNVAGNNSFATFATTDGSNFTATNVSIASAPPNSGDFKLGITFQDADTVMGSTTAYRLVRIVDFAGSTGTLVNTYAAEGAFLNPMDFANVYNKPLLATVSTSDSKLYVYDTTPPFDSVNGNPHVVVSTATTSHNQNINATGQAKFGAITGNTAILYALDTNNGIQAFQLTLDLIVAPGVSGDYNANGVVDSADYVLWRDTLGQTVSPAGSGADGDGSGTVGPEDYDFWRARFGNVAGSGTIVSASVPEPGAIALGSLAVSSILLCCGRRRTAA